MYETANSFSLSRRESRGDKRKATKQTATGFDLKPIRNASVEMPTLREG